MEQIIGDDELDRQLRDAVPYIDDHGFTARVMQSLPVAQAAPARLRSVILIAVTLLASGLAYVLSGGGRFVDSALLQLFSLSTVWLLVLSCAAGVIVGAIGLTAAVFKAREPALISR